MSESIPVRFSIRETKKSLKLCISPRNLEQITQNTEYASICGFLGDRRRIQPPLVRKVPKWTLGPLMGYLKTCRDRGFCDISLTLETLHLRISVRAASHEKFAVLDSNVSYLSWIQTQQ